MSRIVEHLERLKLRAGPRLIAVFDRHSACQVVLQYCVSELEPDLRAILDRGLYEWTDTGETAEPIVTSQADPKFLERVASHFARRFGFTAVLEHADP